MLYPDEEEELDPRKINEELPRARGMAHFFIPDPNRPQGRLADLTCTGCQVSFRPHVMTVHPYTRKPYCPSCWKAEQARPLEYYSRLAQDPAFLARDRERCRQYRIRKAEQRKAARVTGLGQNA